MHLGYSSWGVHRLQASYQLTKIRRDGVSLTSFESVHSRRSETAVPTGGNKDYQTGPLSVSHAVRLWPRLVL